MQIIEFPERETEEERRVRAMIAVGNIASDVALRVVIKLETASQEQRHACLDSLDLTGPNLELAVWARQAPPEQAESILGLANRFSETEDKSSVCPKFGESKK